MPSKHKQIQFRSPWLRRTKGERADRIAQVILEHSKDSLEIDKCPVCGKHFDECEYFQRLNDE